jgi:YD repeat-containing protein
MFRIPFYLAGWLLLAASAFSAFAQSGEDDARVTVAINPDGSKTVYQKDGGHNQAIATTTGADGKPQGKIIYKLDREGRYESGQVFAPNGTLRFVTRYQYNSAGRLVQETQLAKDNSVRSKIVYDYDSAGHPAGYAIYDGDGKLLGRTSPKAPAKEAHPTRSPH